MQATGRIEQHFSQLEAKQKSEASTPDDAPPAWKTRATQLEPLERQTRPLITVFAGLPGQPDGDFQPVVDQALHLLNSPTILPLLRDDPSTLLKRLTAISETEPLAEELSLSVLSRRPNAGETAQVRELIESKKSPEERREPLTALIWGLLFFQGETDTLDPVQYPDPQPNPLDWSRLFTSFVTDYRNDLNQPDLPVVFAQLGSTISTEAFIFWDTVKEQQSSLQLPMTAMIITDDLPLMDGLHFTAESYEIIGQRFAEAYWNLHEQESVK